MIWQGLQLMYVAFFFFSYSPIFEWIMAQMRVAPNEVIMESRDFNDTNTTYETIKDLHQGRVYARAESMPVESATQASLLF
jgi:hypothetical protein